MALVEFEFLEHKVLFSFVYEEGVYILWLPLLSKIMRIIIRITIINYFKQVILQISETIFVSCISFIERCL